jgi:hypothetical protein
MKKDGKDEKESDYRRTYPLAHLPADGRVPPECATGYPNARQLQEFLDRLEKFSRSIEIWLSCRTATEDERSSPVTQDQIARAWRLWLQSHHGFFFNFAILAYAYDQLSEAANKSALAAATQWAEDVAALWRSAGALMMYGCDFHPTQAIYCAYIRAEMPEAFSGFWLREWVEVRRSSHIWDQVARAIASPELAALQTVVKAGQHAYHRHHEYVMHVAVPDGKSLAREYQSQQGSAHPITEHEFQSYDAWFRAVRVAQTRAEFSEMACREFSRTIAEIERGNFLAESVMNDLRLGFGTIVRILRTWLRQTSTTSNDESLVSQRGR